MKLKAILLSHNFQQYCRKAMAITAIAGLLMLSACGDNNASDQTQDIQSVAKAVQQASELVKSADKVAAGSGNVSAAELVAEHNIHWSQHALFPTDTLDGKTGLQAAYVGYARLEKLAANKYIDRQIRRCHESVGGLAGLGTLEGLANQYNFENATLMNMFKEEVATHNERKGELLENDLGLYYIGLVKQYKKTLSKDNKRSVNEAFWQWCIALPNTHWSETYRNNPINL
ncbi:hypothetical protein [Rheinheimera sp. WS51]|uniref:hypothetical protein n=1 Tax=Rheinheimera sp. WS51 TaxID=3425886 RepID=UPI003D90E8ED